MLDEVPGEDVPKRRPYTMTPAKLRLAQAAMAKRDTKVGELCKELGVTRQTLYRFVDPKGGLRADGAQLLKRKGSCPPSGKPDHLAGGEWRFPRCQEGD